VTNDINNQVDYWNDVAWTKEFTHSVDLTLLREWLPLDSRILDFGCGYGRVCHELVQAGYRDVVGVDSSAEMIRRGRQQYPGLRLEARGLSELSFPANSFDAVLLIAVLTCIPEDSGQRALIAELKALLRSTSPTIRCSRTNGISSATRSTSPSSEPMAYSDYPKGP
jgi:SAM-dependent methyltransferase